ncbi:MAG: PDZ domain-containing protein, partial [Planctomycetes bacterium]|nr:PDZ domain-containing protein [Planctomycetota bacterium]
VGLAAGSPWRLRGLVFGDLVVSIDGKPVAHPQQVLEAIQTAKRDASLSLEFVRKGERRTVEVPVSRRAQEVRRFSIPFVYSYENDRGTTESSFLLGAFRKRSTPAAWDCRVLWLISFSGGDADRLVEVKE